MIKEEKLKRILEIGCIPTDTPEERLRKKIMTIMVIPYSFSGIILGLYFMQNGNVISGLIPFVYGIVSLTTFFHFIYTKRYNIFRFSQVGFILVLPFFLQLSLGGFSQSSGMLLWSCTAPFIALVFYDFKTAKKWFYALVFLLVSACFLDESAREYFPKEIDANSIVGVYGANFILISSLIFTIQMFFFNEIKKNKVELAETENLLEASKKVDKQKELLIASKDRLELVMESLEEVVWGRNLPDYQMQYVSNSVVKLYGFPISDWYENPNLWSDMIHPDDLTHIEKEGESLFTRGITKLEYRIITLNKEIKWIHSTTRILKKADGTPFFMTGIAKDITKLKEAEFKLVGSEKNYRELFEKSADAALILKNNLFIQCNDAAIKMLGYEDRAELFNMPPHKLSPEKQPDGQLSSEKSKKMNDIAYKTGSNRFEWNHVKSNGEVFPVEVLLTNLPSENINDKKLHVVWRDITENKNAQEQLNQLNNKLEEKVHHRTIELEESLTREKELGKLKSTFVTTASHQFRTPLAIIQSNAELLEILSANGQKIEPENYKKVSGRIKKAIAKMTGLMEDVLILGKTTAGKTQYNAEDVALVEFCEKLVEEFNELKTDGSHLNFVIKGEPYNLALDPALLAHSLSNLISNAFKYSVGKKNPDLTIHFKPNELVLSIKDYGIGIPENELPKLFQPFFRANNVTGFQGTGLGLSIAKEYIEVNKGNITATSILGEGSCFEIKFKI
jgi:PAS domain S-box-containing protein